MSDTPDDKSLPESVSPIIDETLPQNVDVETIPSAPDVSLDAALSADMAKLQKKKNGKRSLPSVKLEKKHKIMLGAGIGILFVILAIYSGRPQQGSMAYGICSTFLELNTPYPHTLRHIALEGSQTAIRIYYTNVDPFGEFKQEMIECSFASTPNGGMRVAQILRNRKPVDAQLVTDFNKILGTVVASDPYRVPPPHWKNPLLED